MEFVNMQSKHHSFLHRTRVLPRFTHLCLFWFARDMVNYFKLILMVHWKDVTHVHALKSQES